MFTLIPTGGRGKRAAERVGTSRDRESQSRDRESQSMGNNMLVWKTTPTGWSSLRQAFRWATGT